MRPNLSKFLPVVIGITTCVVISSCEKNLFNAEKTKETYEKTFPVKNIDPAMDWKTTQTTQVSIVVNEDRGTNYKVQIFDSNPLNKETQAKLLTEGFANDNLAFETVMDCPKALSTVFVARVDAKGRYLVQPAVIVDGKLSVQIGMSTTRTAHAMTRAGESAVPSVMAPYTAAEITAMLATATEVKANWDLTAESTWGGDYANYDVFKHTDRVFKITNNNNIYFQSNQPGKNIKLIIASDNVSIPESFSNSLEIIVAPAAILNLKNGTYTLPTECRMTVMPGGTVTGAGASVTFNNHSEGKLNYNGGTIDIKQINFNAGTNRCFYNYGTLKLQTYNSTNANIFVNRGTAILGSYDGYNSSVKSACYLEVTNNLLSSNIVVGSNSMIKTGTLTHTAGTGLKILMEKNSMINCLGAANLTRQVTGPTEGYALFKMNNVSGNVYDGKDQSYIKNNVICEVTNQTTNKGVKSDWASNRPYTWSTFDWLVNSLLQNGASYCNPGKANFTLPAGECTGGGYEGEEEEDPVTPEPITYTYAYEDNYPNPGDYDFNDIVFDVAPKYIRDASNKIQKIEFSIKLRAIGGIKMHGAGLRLIGVNKGQVSSISFTDPNSMRNTLGNALFDNVLQESSDPNLVIPIFGDAHKIVGYGEDNRPMLNTRSEGPSFAPVSLTMTLTLTDQTKTTPLLTNDNLDFFIGYPGIAGTRTEIHLYEFRNAGATAKGVIHVENMAAAGKITWAIRVPGLKYPTEKTVITDAYPDFEKWATSGGLVPEFADWYLRPTTVAGNIY